MRIVAFLLFVLVFQLNASAVDSVEMKNDAWILSSSTKNNGVKAYMTSFPVSSKTSHKQKRNAFIQIVCLENDGYQVSVENDFATLGATIVSVNGVDFNFSQTQNNISFLPKIKIQEFLAEILTAFELKSLSSSVSGTYAVDTYSLADFNKTFQVMQKICSN